ncbi:hypothetical protein ACFXG4_08490 [Nocardia sp. NPDC059246]|uniref:hypothetical protein n=1 Tax=unclassified Nocardia TaxID=2637762 RepID=UPI0036ACD307
MPVSDRPAHLALIDWTAGLITINGHELPWPVLADGLTVQHPTDDHPYGLITCTVLAERVDLDGVHIILDDHTMPWRLNLAGPSVVWMGRMWAVTLPILVDAITEHGRPQPAEVLDIDDQDDPEDTAPTRPGSDTDPDHDRDLANTIEAGAR